MHSNYFPHKILIRENKLFNVRHKSKLKSAFLLLFRLTNFVTFKSFNGHDDLQFETSGALWSFGQRKINFDEKTDGRISREVWILRITYYQGKYLLHFITTNLL